MSCILTLKRHFSISILFIVRFIRDSIVTKVFFIDIVRSSNRHNMLRPARSTGNLIDISSPPSSNDDRDDIKILNRRHNSPSIGSEKPNVDSIDHNLTGQRKFYPSNRSSKSYTSTVSSKIKKQNLHTTNNSTNSLGSNINASNLLSITR